MISHKITEIMHKGKQLYCIENYGFKLCLTVEFILSLHDCYLEMHRESNVILGATVRVQFYGV